MISAFLENKVSRAAKLREVMLPRKNLHSDLDSIILVGEPSWGPMGALVSLPAWLCSLPAWLCSLPAWLCSLPAWLCSPPAWLWSLPAWLWVPY